MRFSGRGLLLGAVLLAGAGRPAGAQVVPAEWLREPPGERAAAVIVQGAGHYGWPAMAKALRAAALEAYTRGGLAPAEAWRNAARWAGVWAADAGVAPRPWLLADAEFSAAYFAREQPEDDRGAALRILDELRGRDTRAFGEYASLALAIALVYDTPPPGRDWPHWQVTEQALPRRLPAPADAFAYFTELDRSGRSLQKLSRLDAAELRFLVDLAAPLDELRWAREKVKTPLARLDETYASVAYRRDRIEDGAYVWPGRRYTLEEILAEGGICVDQAYFAAQAGKARGVPTLLFGGAGRDGRHAWFGYLGTGRRWHMDAGRYAEQQFVTGLAIDPQTWAEVSDHELAFLSEGFRREKNAREAAIHAGFAGWLREEGKRAEAEAAARAAVRLERRELAGWEVLLALRPEAGTEREAVAREAAGGLSAYPELQARFMEAAIASLRARGEAEEADRLGRELARRFADRRSDLSLIQIARELEAAGARPPGEQLKLFRSRLRRFGHGAGAGMWDEVVRPFVMRLARAGNLAEARAALAEAREVLGGGGGSQLDTEMREAEAALAAAERAARVR